MSRLVSLSSLSRRRLYPVATSLLPALDTVRFYSATTARLEDAVAPAKKEDTLKLKEVAKEYRRRTDSYKQQLSHLRKEYKEEYLRNRAEDEAAREAEKVELTRKRLERQRAKNIRSAQNAMRQQELRRQLDLAFQDHLKTQQAKRDVTKVLFSKARQLIVDELEEEAPLWLTTPEEVDAAFTHESEQLLWARPNGFMGVPEPSLDSHFWQYETHTWRVEKTYKTAQQILLEELEEATYERANVDSKFWTPERLAEREALEAKAKLRAMVRMEGRKSLLRRQQEYLAEATTTADDEVPRAAAVPSLKVLSNIEAQEKEGSDLLFRDPTKFFVFDRDIDATEATAEDAANEEGSDSDYAGPGLGAPTGLRDPLRTGSPQGRVFPIVVGKLPKPDTRSEKDKRREEREQKLWAAAQAEARSDEDDLDMAVDEDMAFGEPIDYDNNEDWDSDDEEWVKGLDPDLDKDIINAPQERRYREEDVDWVIEQLEAKAKRIESNVRNSYNTMQEELKRKIESDQLILDEAAAVEASSDDMSANEVDSAKVESVLSSLTTEQLVALFNIGVDGLGKETDEADGTSAIDSLEASLKNIPGLSDDQIKSILEIEDVLQSPDDSTETEN